MDLGRELVACALREGSLKPFAEAGLSPAYLSDASDHSKSMIFSDDTMAAWMHLQNHWEKYRKVPTVDLFQTAFPATAFELPATSYAPAELLDRFQEERRKALLAAWPICCRTWSTPSRSSRIPTRPPTSWSPGMTRSTTSRAASTAS
jgi:hypothetical protein